MGKKGQITVFIIIAILLVAAIGITFFVKHQLDDSSTIDPLKQAGVSDELIFGPYLEYSSSKSPLTGNAVAGEDAVEVYYGGNNTYFPSIILTNESKFFHTNYFVSGATCNGDSVEGYLNCSSFGYHCYSGDISLEAYNSGPQNGAICYKDCSACNCEVYYGHRINSEIFQPLGQMCGGQQMMNTFVVSSACGDFYIARPTDGECNCTLNCVGKVCGSDGCGGSCGSCSTGTCSNGACITQPIQQNRTIISGSSYPRIFADITDTHLPIFGFSNIRTIVQKINQHNVLWTVITGDIASDSYFYDNNEIKTELDTLTTGYYPVPGNHDITGTYSSSPDDPTKRFREVFGLSSTNYVVSIDNEYQAVFLSCTKDYNQFPTDMAHCSDDELAALQNALSNGKQTFVFVHYPVLQVFGHETPRYPTANLNRLKNILNVPNLVALVVGHDGCEKGIYTVENNIRQYMGAHMDCDSWCSGGCSAQNIPAHTIPTISYFNLYSNKVIITQECMTSGCNNPAQIEIPISVN